MSVRINHIVYVLKLFVELVPNRLESWEITPQFIEPCTQDSFFDLRYAKSNGNRWFFICVIFMKWINMVLIQVKLQLEFLSVQIIRNVHVLQSWFDFWFNQIWMHSWIQRELIWVVRLIRIKLFVWRSEISFFALLTIQSRSPYSPPRLWLWDRRFLLNLDSFFLLFHSGFFFMVLSINHFMHHFQMIVLQVYLLHPGMIDYFDQS